MPDPILFSGDCLDVMPLLEEKSIDLVLTDLPYGTTYARWDSCIDLERLWEEWLRLLKPCGAIVLTASQPFTSQLVMSRPKLFRCEWIWDKVMGANFANSSHQPLKVHESVLVFSPGKATYNPQKTRGAVNHCQGRNARPRKCETQVISDRAKDDLSGWKFPKSIQTFPKHSSQSKLHSTQKPVELFEYLIRTYSNEGNMVLDCCAGSGTTGVAAMRSGRQSILIEKDDSCMEIIRKRLFPVKD